MAGKSRSAGRRAPARRSPAQRSSAKRSKPASSKPASRRPAALKPKPKAKPKPKPKRRLGARRTGGGAGTLSWHRQPGVAQDAQAAEHDDSDSSCASTCCEGNKARVIFFLFILLLGAILAGVFLTDAWSGSTTHFHLRDGESAVFELPAPGTLLHYAKVELQPASATAQICVDDIAAKASDLVFNSGHSCVRDIGATVNSGSFHVLSWYLLPGSIVAINYTMTHTGHSSSAVSVGLVGSASLEDFKKGFPSAQPFYSRLHKHDVAADMFGSFVYTVKAGDVPSSGGEVFAIWIPRSLYGTIVTVVGAAHLFHADQASVGSGATSGCPVGALGSVEVEMPLQVGPRSLVISPRTRDLHTYPRTDFVPRPGPIGPRCPAESDTKYQISVTVSARSGFIWGVLIAAAALPAIAYFLYLRCCDTSADGGEEEEGDEETGSLEHGVAGGQGSGADGVPMQAVSGTPNADSGQQPEHIISMPGPGAGVPSGSGPGSSYGPYGHDAVPAASAPVIGFGMGYRPPGAPSPHPPAPYAHPAPASSLTMASGPGGPPAFYNTSPQAPPADMPPAYDEGMLWGQ